MIEKVEGFDNQVESSPLAHREVLERAQIKVNEARSRKAFRAKPDGREASGKAPLCSSSAPVNGLMGSPAAERHDWSHLDVTQNLAEQDVPFASCPNPLMRNCSYIASGLRRAGFAGGWL